MKNDFRLLVFGGVEVWNPRFGRDAIAMAVCSGKCAVAVCRGQCAEGSGKWEQGGTRTDEAPLRGAPLSLNGLTRLIDRHVFW